MTYAYVSFDPKTSRSFDVMLAATALMPTRKAFTILPNGRIIVHAPVMTKTEIKSEPTLKLVMQIAAMYNGVLHMQGLTGATQNRVAEIKAGMDKSGAFKDLRGESISVALLFGQPGQPAHPETITVSRTGQQPTDIAPV